MSLFLKGIFKLPIKELKSRNISEVELCYGHYQLSPNTQPCIGYFLEGRFEAQFGIKYRYIHGFTNMNLLVCRSDFDYIERMVFAELKENGIPTKTIKEQKC